MKSNIEIKVCTADHTKQVTSILAKAFSNEPSIKGCIVGKPITTDQLEKYLSFFILDCCTNGLSSVAYDKSNDQVVGVFICRDFHIPLSNELEDYAVSIPRLLHISKMLDIIDSKFYENHPEYNEKPLGKVVDFWMVGVHPSYTGLGLSKLLTEKCLELVKGKFEYAIMECTGFFSQRMATKSGFSVVKTLNYLDYLVDSKPIFVNAEKPHDKWQLFEIKL